jgi:hypothetical protein
VAEEAASGTDESVIEAIISYVIRDKSETT